jgi:F0F1-type ATP synthase assembly protein I
MPAGRDNIFAQVVRYASLALVLPVATFVGFAIGYLLDKAFATVFLRWVFAVLGVVGGFVETIREVQETTKDL